MLSWAGRCPEGIGFDRETKETRPRGTGFRFVVSRVGAVDSLDGLYDGAEHVADRRAEQQKDSYHYNSYKNKDHRILDQTLPHLSR